MVDEAIVSKLACFNVAHQIAVHRTLTTATGHRALGQSSLQGARAAGFVICLPITTAGRGHRNAGDGGGASLPIHLHRRYVIDGSD